jgi:acyl carrier protein
MAKMEIPLNGSNFVSENRQNAFEKALSDDHQINCEDEPRLNVRGKDTKTGDNLEPLPQFEPATKVDTSFQKGGRSEGNGTFDQALDHTYKHQQRMMEVHQQYLAQQAEYIQLITAVLNQQGKALNIKDHHSAAGMIETFQRTLDNFHAIREQGLQVHREFLIHQASFSEHYLKALEEGEYSPQSSPSPAYSALEQQPPITEWVVKQPPIVLDDQRQMAEVSSTDTRSTAPVPQKTLPENVQSTAISTDDLAEGLLEIVGEKTGYPVEMLELDMDLEADLGIDSIKRVEILGSLEEKYPSLPPADTEVLSQTRTLKEIIEYMENEAGNPSPPSKPQPDRSTSSAPQELKDNATATTIESKEPAHTSSPSELTDILMDIVADKTGYPADMLDQDMDMEADLGIDSIKRVEILGAMEDRVPGLPTVEAEKLAELRTLGQIVDLMGSNKDSPAPEKAIEVENKKKDRSVKPLNTPVKLVPLPVPDRLDITILQDRPILITNDGTELTTSLQAALTDRGWKTIVWEYPEEIRTGQSDNLPADIPAYKQSSLGVDEIKNTLHQIRIDHGIPSGFIHLHPQGGQNGLFSDRDEKIIKEVFFLASSLHDDLIQTDPSARNIFLSVTRTDGTLGFSNGDAFQEGMGLSGLVKSLAWEWPEVFCRFIDFSSTLTESEICDLLINEIHDPNQVTYEIGLSPDHRVTIERETESNL